jgi:hypothetical protein
MTPATALLPQPPVTIDDSRSPVLVIALHAAWSDAEFDDYLARMTSALERATRPIAVVVEVVGSHQPTTEQRRRQAAWMRAHRDLIRRRCAGIAFVFASPIFRFVLSSILLIEPIAIPYVVSTTRDDALAFAKARLARPAFQVATRG